jgi:hypothetical protein
MSTAQRAAEVSLSVMNSSQFGVVHDLSFYELPIQPATGHVFKVGPARQPKFPLFGGDRIEFGEWAGLKL